MPTASKSKTSTVASTPSAMWGMSLSAYEDLFEGQAFSSMTKFQQMSMDVARKCFEKQADFAMKRWQEDLDLMSSLGTCKDPETMTETLQGFYTKMFDAYSDHFTKQGELLQSCMSEGMSAAEELRETATEITKAATKQISDAANDAGKTKAA